MHVPGHLAVGSIVATCWTRRGGRQEEQHLRDLVPVLLGTLTPDVIDKSLKLLEWSPYGRTVGHSLFFLAFLACAALVSHRHQWPGRRPLAWWTLGIGTHVISDLCNDIVAGYWFNARPLSLWFTWPYFNPDMPVWKTDVVPFPCHSCYTPLEIATIAAAGALGISEWRRARQG